MRTSVRIPEDGLQILPRVVERRKDSLSVSCVDTHGIMLECNLAKDGPYVTRKAPPCDCNRTGLAAYGMHGRPAAGLVGRGVADTILRH